MLPVGRGNEEGVQEEGLQPQSPSLGGKGTPGLLVCCVGHRGEGAEIPGICWESPESGRLVQVPVGCEIQGLSFRSWQNLAGRSGL